MPSTQLRLAISAGITVIILITGGVFMWWNGHQEGEGVVHPGAETSIMVDVTAITEVVQSPAFARFVALAPEAKVTTLGNPNPFPGVREEALKR